jgi:hypothetical protein
MSGTLNPTANFALLIDVEQRSVDDEARIAEKKYHVIESLNRCDFSVRFLRVERQLTTTMLGCVQGRAPKVQVDSAQRS